MSSRILAALGVALTVHATAVGAQTSTDRTTLARLRAAGDAYVRKLVDSVGESSDPVVRRDVAALLGQLRIAAGIPNRDFKWVLLNDSTVNASAVPGGHLVINMGLVKLAQGSAAAEFRSDPAKRQRRYLGLLGAVLGHEIAHHTLGHTEQIRELIPATRGGSAAENTIEARIERALANPALLSRQAWSRERELAADRAGSLYMLRAGYEIQDAMDMFRTLDSALERSRLSARPGERQARLLDSVGTLSWLASHPRASEREGALEAFRGNLKQDQARFDDALVLVRTGLQLDTAVVLLDTVLAHFPGLREAQHLRAAALHQRFLRQMPVELLRVRSAVATYPIRFYTKIRDGGARERAMNQARDAYRSIVSDVVLPYSLSNLAVLDAYAGQMPLAVARADSAVRLDDRSHEVRLNQGVVYFLANRYRDALASFQAAARLAGDATPVINFNLGRTMMALGDSAGGRALLRRYAESDEGTEWQAYAVTLAGGSRAPSPSTPTVAKNPGPGTKTATTSTPRVTAPVSLGQSAAAVRAALGPPDATEPLEGGYLWEYESRDLLLGLTRADGVILIGLASAKAGSIDGIRVGDTMAKARATWGTPAGIDGATVYYRRGGLIVMVDDDGDGRIETLTVGVPR